MIYAPRPLLIFYEETRGLEALTGVSFLSLQEKSSKAGDVDGISLEQRRKQQSAPNVLFKCLNNNGPKYFEDFLVLGNLRII